MNLTGGSEPAKSLRELTSDLASALDSAGRSDEALRTYRQAVLEVGASPPAAELYEAMGGVGERVGDSADALDSYLQATIADPARRRPAEKALALLETTEAPAQREVELAESLRSEKAAAAAHRLLGRVRRKTGDADGALAALRQARKLADGTDESGIATDLVDLMLELGDARGAYEEMQACSGGIPEELQAEVLLAGGDFVAAREHAERAGEAGRATAMLAALGLGESATIDVGPPSGGTETVAAAVAVHLDRTDYVAARKLLIDAEAAGVANSDDLAVMQAQVLLEGAGRSGDDRILSGSSVFAEIDEARRVLELVVGSVTTPAVPRWLRRQQDVRGEDDRFRYAWAELLAGFKMDVVQVRQAIESCPRLTTTYLQDAAMDELLADAAFGSMAEIAAARERAARAIDRLEDSERAWGHMDTAEAAESTPDRRLGLADLAWKTAYDLEGDERLKRIRRGLAALDADGGVFEADAGIEPAYTHALLVSLHADLAPSETLAADIERAVPCVLAAMVAEKEDRFRALYAAEVLRHATLRRSAWSAARRCWDLSRRLVDGQASPDPGEEADGEAPDVPWYVANAVVVAGANYGTDPRELEEPFRVLETSADFPDGPDFARAVRFYMDLNLGDRDGVARYLEASPPEGPTVVWQRWAWLSAVLLRDGVDSKRDAVAEIARAAGSTDWDVDLAASAWRLLGDLTSADASVDDAAARGVLPRCDAAALNQLVRGTPGAEKELAGMLAACHAPNELKEWLNVTGPLLANVWPDVEAAMGRLDTVARARLDELEESPPPLEDEINLVPGAAGPDEVSRVLLRLLENEDTASPVDSLTWAAALREARAVGALKPALMAAADSVDRRVHSRLGLEEPVPDPQGLLTPNPIAVELGALVVDHVDPSKPEGEGFIDDQVEAMRQELRLERGIVVPGIRFRAARVHDDEVVVRIGEVPVLRRRIGLDPSGIQPEILVTVRNGVTAYLARVVGPDAVDRLVDEWAEQDPDLVARVLPDAQARLRLTWVVQGALYDGLSVADWPLLLTALEQAGGVDAVVPALVTAVNHALRAAQTPLEDSLLRVPVDVVADFADGTPSAEAQNRLLGWLRDALPVGRPTHLVAPDDLRDTVASLARTVSPAVVTFASSEVMR